MAIGTPVSLGSRATGPGSAASIVLTIGATGAAVGEHVIVFATRNNVIAGMTFADSKGNTYQVDGTFDTANGNFVAASAIITTALVTGDTITATYPSSTFSGCLIGALKVSGLAASGWFEAASNVFDTGFSGAFATTAKANVQADALLVGVAEGSDRTWTSGGAWTELFDVAVASTNSMSAQQQVVSTVAARSTDLTPSSNAGGIAVMLIYKAAAASVPTNTTPPAITGTATTGQTLTCSDGTWTGSPTSYTRQWKRNGSSISGATSSTYVLQVADEGTSVKCAVTAVNGVGSSTPQDSNTVSPTAPPALAFTIRLTGGASNADPLLSLGGAESSVSAGTDLLERITHAVGHIGQIDYRRLSVHNGDAVLSASVKAWLSVLSTGSGVSVAIGVCTTAAGSTIPTIANRTTAPSGTTFSAPTTQGAAIDLGTIGPGQGKGLDVRRIVAAATDAAIASNTVRIRLEVTPL